jgi:transcriptional regulator with XRE-family HTH domain
LRKVKTTIDCYGLDSNDPTVGGRAARRPTISHPVDAHVGQRIRQERLLAGLSQSELADQIGVRFQQMQKYESAANRISASRLWLVARYLGIPVFSLFPSIDGDEAAQQLQVEPEDLALLRQIKKLSDARRTAVMGLVEELNAGHR